MATILDLAQKTLRGEVPPRPVGRLLEFVLKSIEPGRAVFEMEADERHHNPMGTAAMLDHKLEALVSAAVE
jgi:acyl-coenzyme A thioesterase PaaI-like protein